VIWWHRERCGKSEEVHSVLKEDLAGGQMLSVITLFDVPLTRLFDGLPVRSSRCP